MKRATLETLAVTGISFAGGWAVAHFSLRWSSLLLIVIAFPVGLAIGAISWRYFKP